MFWLDIQEALLHFLFNINTLIFLESDSLDFWQNKMWRPFYQNKDEQWAYIFLKSYCFDYLTG